MPQRALYELAEATLGLAPEMQWSTDEEIARRESKRLFERLAEGSTSADAALEVFLISMTAKLEHTTAILEERYNRMLVTLTGDQQAQCPALNEFFEFFTRASAQSDYTLSEEITRKELRPLFLACQAGRLTSEECADAVFDNVLAKRDTTFSILQQSVARLSDQIKLLSLTKAETDDV